MVSETGSTHAAAPTVAYILALIAGVLVVMNGLLLVFAGETLGVSISGGELWFGIVGTAIGLAIMLAAIRLDSHPSQHVGWGAAIILGSAASLILVGGGFLLGFILGVVGGIIAIAWKT